MLNATRFLGPATGLLLVGTTGLAILFEWTGAALVSQLAAAAMILSIALLWLQVSWSRRLFVLVGLFLFIVGAATLPDWREATAAGLRSSSFIAAFFTSLISLRSAAAGSASITECGRFLAGQPPGRRYLALCLGGHLFGLVLSYGAISLLGSMAAESADSEADPRIRGHRLRRMLVAIQRGFVSSLPWSPFGFAVAISTTLIPGATWGAAVGFCAISSLLLVGVGWALDTIFKPRLAVPAQSRGAAQGRWLSHLSPLLLLLSVLVAAVAVFYAIADLRIVAIVMTVVPAIALGWVALQHDGRGGRAAHQVASRAAEYVTVELPRYRSEVVLLTMAGFIGTMGARLGEPLLAASGLDLTAAPGWLILLGMFWLIPIVGQIGMNPILAVSLTAPLLPAPDAVGLSPAALVVAVTSGWAVSGATSPFTASTLLVGALGKVSATHVGTRWNGIYALSCGAVLSLWILVVAHIT